LTVEAYHGIDVAAAQFDKRNCDGSGAVRDLAFEDKTDTKALFDCL
jgi:hypothetical protein